MTHMFWAVSFVVKIVNKKKVFHDNIKYIDRDIQKIYYEMIVIKNSERCSGRTDDTNGIFSHW